MRRINLVLFLAVICFLIQSCGKSEVNPSMQKTQSIYSEKTIKTGLPAEISIDCDNCLLEIYSWKCDEVKFEMSEIINAVQVNTGNNKELKDFDVDIKQDGAKVKFTSEYKGTIGKTQKKNLELKLTIPKRVKLMNVRLDDGSITFIDDVKYDLNINVNNCNTEINNLVGSINYSGHMGDVRISGGRINNKSSINQELGNINIKAELSQDGPFRFQSKIGNINLSLPSYSELSFENIGAVDKNEFKQASGPVKVYNKTEIGTISIRKY